MSFEEVLLSVLAMGGAFGLLLPLVRALGERLRPRPPAVDAGAEAFRDEVLQELQHVRREVGELGERLDFAERLLAQQHDGQRLGPGGVNA